MKKGYRRRYVVDGWYQFSQAAAAVVANILVLLLMAALLSWFYLLVWDGSIAINHNNRIPVYIVCCLAIVTLFSIFFSFRRSRIIAGMMEKLYSILDDASRGVLPERDVVFRKNDYFSELETPLNACLQTFRNSEGFDRSAVVARIENLLHQAETNGMDGREIRKELAMVAEELRAELVSRHASNASGR